MAQTLTLHTLAADNRFFAGTGGVSQGNRQRGFTPGFLDCDTGAVYPSCWADGRPAPFHALEGLPDHLVLNRGPTGRVATVKASVIAAAAASTPGSRLPAVSNRDPEGVAARAKPVRQAPNWPQPAILRALPLQFKIPRLWFFITSAIVGARATALRAVAEDHPSLSDVIRPVLPAGCF